MQKISSITIIITLVISTSCTTAPSAQGIEDPTQQQQTENTRVVTEQDSQDTSADSSVEDISSLHPYSDERIADALDDLPDSCIGEDGLFELVNPKYYLTDSWYKGYAGMFTQEDLNGKTIGGYEVNLPMQIFGSWSADGREYFERVDDDDLGMFPRSSRYRNRFAWSRPEFRNFSEETPYRELDTEYREMIKEDASLTVDQQLELIIKNHMGYVRNMEIGDLAMQTVEQISSHGLQEHLNDAFGVRQIFDIGRSGFETIFHYDNEVYITYHNQHDDSMGMEFVERIASSLEIMRHRLPLIYDEILLPEEGTYLRIALVDEDSNNSAVSRRINDGISHIDFYPGYTRRKLEAEDFVSEGLLSTFFHELIHTSIQQGQMHNFSYAEEGFHDIIDEFFENGRMSELLTYSSVFFLGETINMSYGGGYTGKGIHAWYGYVDNYNLWDGKDPMDYYVRIIDNRLGQ